MLAQRLLWRAALVSTLAGGGSLSAQTVQIAPLPAATDTLEGNAPGTAEAGATGAASPSFTPGGDAPTLPPLTVEAISDSFPANPLPNDTVITATRTEANINTIGSSITVITQQQMQDRGFENAYEVLRAQLGVDVVNSGGPGRQTSIFMRGANSAQTKVLIDGMPANDPSSPARAFDFGSLTVDNLDRIEVLRGPQSTLYGSDAIGGVINLVTKRGSGPPKARIATQVGAYNTTVQNIDFSGGTDKIYYSASGSYQDSDGFSNQNFGSERDGYHIGTFASRVGWTPNENFDLDFVVRHTQSVIDLDGFDDFFNPYDDPFKVNKLDQTTARGQARLVLFDDIWEQKLGLGVTRYDRSDPTAVFQPVGFFGQTVRLDWQNNIAISETNLLSVGIDTQEETAEPDGLPQTQLQNTGVYIQDQLQLLDNWYATIGGRLDDYSQAGNADTYRVTTRYTVTQTKTSFKGSLGTGFRAPTLNDLYGPYSANPNLLPEESKGWDYGIEQLLFEEQILLGVTYFRNDFTNLINAGPPPLYQLENIDKARSVGLEVTAQAQLDDDTSLAFFYTYTNANNLVTDLPLLRRPRDKALITLNRKFLEGRANANMSCVIVGDRQDVNDFGQRVTLAKYTVFNVAGSYQVNDYVSVFARIDNLFGEHYEEVLTYNVPGCTLYAGVAIGSW